MITGSRAWPAPLDRLEQRHEVPLVLQIETRGPEHCSEVIGALRGAGYTLAFA